MKDKKEYNYLDLSKTAVIIVPISFIIGIIGTIIFIFKDLIIWKINLKIRN